MDLSGLYVDEPTEHPAEAVREAAKVYGRVWSHLWCDPGREVALHAAARASGCRPCWFQNKAGFPHYDMTPTRFARAKRLGVEVKSLREWLAENRTPPRSRVMAAIEDGEPHDD